MFVSGSSSVRSHVAFPPTQTNSLTIGMGTVEFSNVGRFVIGDQMLAAGCLVVSSWVPPYLIPNRPTTSCQERFRRFPGPLAGLSGRLAERQRGGAPAGAAALTRYGEAVVDRLASSTA